MRRWITAVCLLFLGASTVTGKSYFPSFSDDNTVGLWLFDESYYPQTTLTDAGPYRHDLILMKGRMDSGKFGGALKIKGGHAVTYAGFAGKLPEEEIREKDGYPSGLWGPTEGPGKLLDGLASDSLGEESSAIDEALADMDWLHGDLDR